MALPRYYGKKHLEKIKETRQQIQRKTDNLLLRFVGFRFENVKAAEYAQHGFARRIQILNRCIQNLFKAIPPGAVKVPKRGRLHDATINMQAFFANAYGCIDNLAWIWVHERGKRLKRNEVGLWKHNKKVRNTLSPELRGFLRTRDEWFSYLSEFRHALGHRVPPYIPPGGVRKKDQAAYTELQGKIDEARAALNPTEHDRLIEEQERLYVFQPLMTHSFKEATGIIRFHQQILSDFLTVEELAYKMLDELKTYRASKRPTA
jgi:hypothetical protein